MSIQVSPSNQSWLTSGLVHPYTATGTYSDRSTRDITSTVTWTTASVKVASVSDTAASKGQLRSSGVGTTQVRATLGTVLGSTNVTFTVDGLVRYPGREFAAGTLPEGFAAGDFNGDGKQDLVITNFSTHSISLVLGNGDGTFGAPTTYSTGGRYPQSVVVGDFNGDKRLDVAVSNSDSANVSIFLGQGDGTLATPVLYSVGGVNAGPLVAVDLNRDRKIDLAVLVTGNGGWGDNGTSKLSILLGLGDGTFSTPSVLPAARAPRSIAAADVNGDGLMDLVTCGYDPGSSNTVSVFAGDGKGGFTRTDNFAQMAPLSIAVADLNGDGKPDLVTAHPSLNAVCVMLNKGNGAWSYPTAVSVGSSPQWVALADLNGDGRPDVVTCNTTANTASVLLGKGDGNFAASVEYHVGTGPLQGLLVDLNGDGRLDFVETNPQLNNFAVFLGDKGGTFQAARVSDAHPWPWGAAMGDFNEDGCLDVVTTNDQTGYLYVQMGAADGSFGTPTAYGSGGYASKVGVGDINGDGHLDLVVTDAWANGITVMLGKGDGTFTYVPGTITVGSGPFNMALGDLNGDGCTDIVTSNYGNSYSIVYGSRTASTGLAGGTYSLPMGSNPTGVALGDLDGDGRLDIVLAKNQPGTVSVILSTPNGPGVAKDYTAIGSPGPIAVGDFNGDGLLDVAVGSTWNTQTNTKSTSLAVLWGTGKGALGSPSVYTVGTTPNSLAAADLNGDGRCDLVVTHDDSNDLAVLLGTASKALAAPAFFVAAKSTRPLVICDINRDGCPDLVVGNFVANSLWSLLQLPPP